MQIARLEVDLSVAILMDDFGSAKDIASALRQHNILAHHYQTLEEFWVASNIQTPDLVIVDVTKMSQGSVQFRQHPKVIDQSMSYIFFSKESTKILLQSTFGLKPFGYVHNDASLNAQIMCLVDRRISEIQKTQKVNELEVRVQRLQSRSQRMISDRSMAEEFRANFDFVRKLCTDLEEDSDRQDFTIGLISKLDAWDAIDGFGIFELNPSGQKLVSPENPKKKYHPLPSLWLGQTNTAGIETFAQNMAQQVVNDLFEQEPVMIRIHGGSSSPDILLFVSFNQDRMLAFPWDVLESSLSSSFRRLKLHRQLPQYSSQFLPMWEALDNMDRMQKAGVDADMRILSLSLIPLTDVAKRRVQNKFYWSSFFNDFFLQLSGRIQKSTKLSLFGPWQVVFFIPKENLETEYQMLQSFVRQFGYWKFFEDNSQILSEDMYPIIKMIPASSAHFLRLFEKEFEEMHNQHEAKRLMTMSRSDNKRLSI